MLHPAFSTVACPDWTLERVAQTASRLGYEGVELRTFGHASAHCACDPTLTAPAKVRRLFADAGVKIACLATSVHFDEPIRPAIVGRLISDTEKSVRAAKSAIDFAAQIECPLVRVFGFESRPAEPRRAFIGRVLERLVPVVDAARNTGVRVVVENGGSFGTARELVDLIDRVTGPARMMIGAAYDNGAASLAHDDPTLAAGTLGDRLLIAKIRDYTVEGKPCQLGDGRLECEEYVKSLARASIDIPLVLQWDRAWLPAEGADAVLPAAIDRMREWMMEGSPTISGKPAARGATA